jgi:ubiquitin C-terminal hydrolase
VSSAAVTLCVASQRMFIVVSRYVVIESVRKRLDTPMYLHIHMSHDIIREFLYL